MLVIDAQDLGAEGFHLDLGLSGGRERWVRLGPTRGIHGRYTIDSDEQRLDAIGCALVQVTGVDWGMGPVGFRSTDEVRVEGLDINMVLPRNGDPVRGRISVAQLVTSTATLELAGLEVPLELKNVAIGGIELEFVAGEIRVSVASVSAERVGFASSGVRIVARDLQLPAGISWAGGEFRCAQVNLGEVGMSLQDLVLGAAQSGSSLPPAQPLESGVWENPRVYAQSGWWDILDCIEGQFDVDLRVDVTVPLIGRRRATHHFRIPIHRGIINFIGVERNLSALEDAVLDFKVRDGKLMLVKDIPLVPIDRKTLVSWILPPNELPLAERNEVRLRRLLDFRLPRASKLATVDSKPSRFALRSLAFDDLTFTLSLRAAPSFALFGGRISLGNAESPALASAKFEGDLRHEPGAVATPRTALALELRELLLGIEAIPLGGDNLLDIGTVRVAAVDKAKINFEGIFPRSFTTKLHGVELERVRIGPESMA